MSTFEVEDLFSNDINTIGDSFDFNDNLGRILTDLDMIKRNQSDFQTGYEEQKQSIRNVEFAVQTLTDNFRAFYEEQKQKDQRVLSLLEQLVTQKNTKITQEKLPRLSNQTKANSGKISIAQWCCEPNVGATDNTTALITSTSHVSPSLSSIAQTSSYPMDYELSQQIQPFNTARKISFLHPFDGQLSAQTDRGTLLKDTNGQAPVLVLRDCHFPADTQIEIAAVSRSDNGEFLSPFQFHDKNDGYRRFEHRPIGLINADYQQIKLENLKLYKLVNNEMKDDGRFTVRSYPSDAVIKTSICSPKDLNEQYKFDHLQIAIRFRRGDEILSQGILYSNPLIKGKTKLSNLYQLSITSLDITNNFISFDSNHQAQMKFHVEIPHEFHCTIDSGSKYLRASVVTNDQPSLIYSISPEVIPIQKQSFEMTLTIRKPFYDHEILNSILQRPDLQYFNIKMQIFHQDTLNSNESKLYDTCPAWKSIEFTEDNSFYSNSVTQNLQKRTYDQIDDLR